MRGRLAGRVLLVGLLVLLGVGAWFYWDPLWFVDQVLRWKLAQAGAKSDYMQVDGHRVHYLEVRPEGGGRERPLVLVHGLGARGEDWVAMIPALRSAGFHLYVPDLLGYGRSDRPDAAYTIASEEEMVAGFMREKGIVRADVGGWSMGGWVAMKLALDHPETVDRLAVFDSAGMYFPTTFDASVFTPKDVAGLRTLLAMLTPKRIELPEFGARAMIRRMGRNAWVVHRSVASMMNGRDLLEFRAYRISQPMLIVWGAEDRLIPISVGETLHRAVPQSHMAVMEGCGHLAPADCASQVSQATVAFLTAQPATAGGETRYPAR